jgi:hypothetical protein
MVVEDVLAKVTVSLGANPSFSVPASDVVPGCLSVVAGEVNDAGKVSVNQSWLSACFAVRRSLGMGRMRANIKSIVMLLALES